MVIRDRAGFNDGVADNDVNAGQPGAITGDAGMTFGTAEPNQPWGRIYANGTQYAPDTFTTQAWIKTSTTNGGRIFGFSDLQTGNSGHHDRHIYMNNDGKLNFGVRAQDGGNRTIGSGKSYNDNQWHMVTATMGSTGMALYVDGVRVGPPFRHHPGRDLPRLLAGRRRQPRRLGQPAVQRQLRRLDRRGRRLPDRPGPEHQIIAQYSASGRTSVDPGGPGRRLRRRRLQRRPRPVLALRRDRPAPPPPTRAARSTTARTATASSLGQPTGVLSGNKAAGFDGSDDFVLVQRRVLQSDGVHRGGVVQDRPPPGRQDHRLRQRARPADSGNYDRHVYMQDDGQLVFGVWTGFRRTRSPRRPLTTTTQWHHVVASQGADGMKLYVDGELSGTNPQTQCPGLHGYWKVGGDSTWGRQPVLQRRHRRGGGLQLRAAAAAGSRPTSRRAAAMLNQPPTAAFTSIDEPAPGHVRPAPAPTPTAAIAATAGTSVTAHRRPSRTRPTSTPPTAPTR